MKILFVAFLWSIVVITTVSAQHTKPGAPIQTPAAILKNQSSFSSYIGEDLDLLSANYTAYDEKSNTISKGDFLKKINTGDYLFVRLSSADPKLYFKLYKLNPTEKKLYGDIIYAYVRSYYDNYKWVGKKFPVFNFTDIRGNNYTSKNSLGKILLIKCWFIGCQACVGEMPDLNNLVQSYKGHNDILFISLAPDTKPKLQAFLKTGDLIMLKCLTRKALWSRRWKWCKHPFPKTKNASKCRIFI